MWKRWIIIIIHMIISLGGHHLRLIKSFKEISGYRDFVTTGWDDD